MTESKDEQEVRKKIPAPRASGPRLELLEHSFWEGFKTPSSFEPNPPSAPSDQEGT